MALLGALAAVTLQAQAPRPQATPAVKARPTGFPERPPGDPAMIERGKAVFGVHCAFCHGVDARGGSGGTNLIRAELVMNDKDGELIGPVVRGGREGMPKFDLTASQISDIAAFVHSFRVGGYDVSRMTPPSIVVGDAKAGEAYFGEACASCHSVTGNLKGIATKITDPKALQQTWLMPGSGRFGFGGPQQGPVRVPPTTVTVTLAGGKKVEGRLVRIDDFFVALADEDGTQRTFTRNGEVPKVELHDPLKGHRDLLGTYRDKDIHDVTAYLVTVK
jgi:mono/diheme cytochrome c family protein